jgi:dihydroneopterin aldolase
MRASDRILLPEFRFWARVGLLPGESDAPQELVGRLEIRMDLREAAESDSIEATFDYRRIPQILGELGRAEPCDLLETLAGRILTAILEDRRVLAAGVRLSKASRPLGEEIGPVSVELWRDQGAGEKGGEG